MRPKLYKEYIENVQKILESGHRILLTTPTRTASTVLANVILGLIHHHYPLFYHHDPSVRLATYDLFRDNILIKTHDTNVDEILRLSPQYKITIITVIRNKDMNIAYCNMSQKYPNVLTFDFNEVNEKSFKKTKDYVCNITTKLKEHLPTELTQILNINQAVLRVKKLNLTYQALKFNTREFETGFPEPFFRFNGSHKDGHCSKMLQKVSNTDVKDKLTVSTPVLKPLKRQLKDAVLNLIEEKEQHEGGSFWLNFDNVEEAFKWFITEAYKKL